MDKNITNKVIIFAIISSIHAYKLVDEKDMHKCSEKAISCEINYKPKCGTNEKKMYRTFGSDCEFEAFQCWYPGESKILIKILKLYVD